jgi:hypothetical protein
MKKAIYKSKTFWVNIIATVLSIITLFDPSFIAVFVADEHHQTKLLVAIGAITGILNIILRSLTSQPVSYKKNKDLNLKGNETTK